MRTEIVNQKLNFGLRAETHKYNNACVMRNMNCFDKKTTDLFVKTVQKPDFDETGLKLFGKETCNNHFYYPPTTFRPRKSHLDFDGKHNAYAKYMSHIGDMRLELKEGNVLLKSMQPEQNIFLMICQ